MTDTDASESECDVMGASMMRAARPVVERLSLIVNPDPALVSDPMFVLLSWAGGVTLAAAAVTVWKIVGPGFTWLASGTALLVGIWPAFTGDLVVVAAALAAAAGGLAVKPNRTVSGVVLAVSAALFTIAAMGFGGPILAITATVALGGITGEMLLGHWYLVDPTMPRLVLRILALGGIAGILLDALMVVATVGSPSGGFASAVFWVLAVTTLGLMVAVIGALRHPAYSGVMAATGLSYLAVLTGLATVFVGRVLATGTGPI